MAGTKRAALRCGIFRERVFSFLVRTVVTRPVLTIIVALILAGALSAGMIFLEDESRIDQLYTPRTSQSLDDLRTYATLFSDQSIRVETVILFPQDEGKRTKNGLLEEDSFNRLFDIHEEVLAIQTKAGDSFESLCYKYHGKNCGVISALEVFNFNRTEMKSRLEQAKWMVDNYSGLSAQSSVSVAVNAFGMNQTHITRLGRAPQFIYPIVFGGQKRPVAGDEAEMQKLLGANALMTQFVLRRSAPVVSDKNDPLEKKTREWELSFDEKMKSLRAKIERETDLTIAWQSERGLEDDSIESTDQDFTLISLTFTIMCTFACVKLSLNFKDEAGKHALLAFMGVFNVAFASFAAFGTGALLGIPFAPIVKVAPFLLLGIGVDDMFLMVNELDSLPANMEPKTRAVTAIVKAAPTVALTSLTDLLAFCAGIYTQFPAITAFCSYMAIGVAFDWLLQMTFFAACLTLDARRIHRDPSLCGYCPCLCKKRQQKGKANKGNETNSTPSASDNSPNTVRQALASSPSNANERSPRGQAERRKTRGGEQDKTKSPYDNSSWGVMRAYGKFITHPISRVAVVALYLILLGGAIYLCTQLQEGLDLQLLSPEGSNLPRYYAAFDAHWRQGIYPELAPSGVEVRIVAWDPSVISAAQEGTTLGCALQQEGRIVSSSPSAITSGTPETSDEQESSSSDAGTSTGGGASTSTDGVTTGSQQQQAGAPSSSDSTQTQTEASSGDTTQSSSSSTPTDTSGSEGQSADPTPAPETAVNTAPAGWTGPPPPGWRGAAPDGYIGPRPDWWTGPPPPGWRPARRLEEAASGDACAEGQTDSPQISSAQLYGQNPFLERFDVALLNLREQGLVLTEADSINYVLVARGTAEFLGVPEGLPLGTVLNGGPDHPQGRSFIVDMGFLKDSALGKLQDADLMERLESILANDGPHAVKAHVLMDVGLDGRDASIGQRDAMLQIRETLEKATGPEFEAIAVALPFRYFEQYAVILEETLRNLAFALLGVAVACLLLTSSFSLALTTCISVLSIDVLILGMMSLWNIAIDSISAVNLVMAIGLAADYVLHVALDIFQPSLDPAVVEKMTGRERVQHALEHTGVAVLSGGVTTFLGVLPTAWARSHVFNIFFKMFVGICGFALLHGLVITPVFLSFIVGARGSQAAKSGKQASQGPSN
uniref:SSD domain-containing protein n=1 Tax=Chromera velia CCMP2878 TaxID=1169474 RepID=A0A0G4I6E2_9ALVE|mmetsp:Transcript_21612/g.42983  ORF Transcript_21612/g.42983 Transcript_21612/m.42983 type:complete len:1171 (+) Transcript_21612:215-3727(+)|eukprot:Cvel_11367.t1-p1 / transcript=Cvel_11367.t1 / gene=Cvel_11367 / organism=Chromera_velia_CCMP2878 / gene_product=Patched domain-containing protein 3, putative / transcript_product=Patched domain-containing protein 3, putative / location=Cvel_scaffold712:52973-59637(+) / protein_length=1170 / sequence_SO=supercontig / SO=protein_coding / is_pseudo=false